MTLFLVLTIILTVIDQISKYFALTLLKPVGNITFIEGFMDFTFVENRGAAFGILHGARWFFLLATIVITVGIIYYVSKKMPKQKEYGYLKFSLMLIMAGAWGNAIDRLFRGYVVDYFEFTFFDWPVFNVADIYVVCGAVLMALIVLFVIKDEKKE